MLLSIRMLIRTPTAWATDWVGSTESRASKSFSYCSWSSLGFGLIIKAGMGQSVVSKKVTPTLNMLISPSSKCFKVESRITLVPAYSIGKIFKLLQSEVNILSVVTKWKWRLLIQHSAPIELYPIQRFGFCEILKI